MNEKALLQDLAARLPELEWKIKSLGSRLSINALPRGLFRVRLNTNAASCVDEIKAVIQQLAREKNDASAHFLAERIQQKISVLVTWCHIQAKKAKIQGNYGLSLEKISTRQQWLQNLENEINRLTEQREALANSLEKIKHRAAAHIILQLKADLGEVEKRLTVAKEALSNA